ncbi:hypothetical protein B0H19DRAFT_1261913 [Mycena capillaripes]|nr:hypothetical protein B0H19DRAFT_1261913 [Mycena capillaripes]
MPGGDQPRDADPGIIELVQSTECAEAIMDRYLDSPPREPIRGRCCCNRCYPSLRPAQQYEWVSVNPGPSTTLPIAHTTDEQREGIYQELTRWRLNDRAPKLGCRDSLALRLWRRQDGIAYMGGSPKIFPAAWLKSMDDDPYVIHYEHGNTEADPEDHSVNKRKVYFSMEWPTWFGTRLLIAETYGVQLAGLVLCLYFGIAGCIVPLGCVPDMNDDCFAFTLAGPLDAADKK